MTSRSSSAVLAGVLLAAAGLAVGWLARGALGPSSAGASGAEAASAEPSVRAETSAVTRGDLPLVVAAVGVVEPAPGAQLTLASLASGRVAEVLARPGARVARGDVLVRFEREPLEAALAEVEARLARAGADLEEFERSGRARRLEELRSQLRAREDRTKLALSRAEQLAPLQEDGLVAERTLAEAEAEARQARADEELARAELAAFRDSTAELRETALRSERDSAGAALERARAVLAEAELRAPLDGELLELSARVGQRFDAGAPLGTLAASSARFLRFGVVPERAAELVVGARAGWSDEAGAPRAGQVAAVLPALDPRTGLQDVIVLPAEAEPAGTPGLVVRGELETGRLRDVLLVPEPAVVRSDDRTSVVVAGDDGRAHRRFVKVLARHAGLAAVEGDLRPVEKVLVENAFNLPDGARIVPAAAGAAATGGPR